METPQPSNSGSDTVQVTAPKSLKLRRKRVGGLIRLVITAAALLCVMPILRRNAAMAHKLDQAPMPLAYSFVASPNCDERPPAAEINCIVLHSTVEPTTEGTMGIFLDPARKVSAHFVVGKDGRVVQMVPIEKRAWHAGTSVLEGIGRVNDYSIGIEMVNLNNGKVPYPQPQLDAVAGLIRFIRSRYPIPDERIVSHAQIALPAGRKTDPEGFDFTKIKALARIGVPDSSGKPTPITGQADNHPVGTDTKPANNP